MPVTTLSAAVHIAPVFVKTFLDHGKRKAKHIKDGRTVEDGSVNARDEDIFFDEGFNIVKAFIQLGTQNTVESCEPPPGLAMGFLNNHEPVQSFTNTHVPSPYWAAVSPLQIPLSSCNRAADSLLEWFDPEELHMVVGGEKWWQVRGLDGIDAEWITEKDFLRNTPPPETLDRKLSTEDENILKMEHLESVVLYIHGGGYFWGSINTHRYQLIRLARKCKGRVFAPNYRKAPQYPWPCPLQDVLAAYFYLIDPPPTALHKPVPASKIVLAGDSAGGGLSLTLLTILRDLGLPMPAGAVLISPWVDLTHSFPSVMNNTTTDIVPPHGFLAKPSPLWPVDLIPPPGGRVSKTENNPPPEPGHADPLLPSAERLEEDNPSHSSRKIMNQEEMLEQSSGHSERQVKDMSEDTDETVVPESWEPKPPKVLMKDPNAVPLELRSQIQLYATTEQLSHPLVSPVLQGSLGSLPPLYIIAGDGEMLRDEIMYIAHKAAHPKQYPTRSGVLKGAHRQSGNAERYTQPTKVHLQVFDDMCHVLTVFTFTKSAKYAYRSIGQFVKHVTTNDQDHLERNPFPELHRPNSVISTSTESSGTSVDTDVHAYETNRDIAEHALREGKMDPLSHTDITASSLEDVEGVRMIRERVNILGIVRPMESKSEIPALNIKSSEIGLIKEEPCLRWLTGQEEWDNRYRKQALSAIKKRKHYERQYEQFLRHVREQGLVLVHDPSKPEGPPTHRRQESSKSVRTIHGTIQDDRRYGPLDLGDEHPPPSAIVGRRDTRESLALLKKHVLYTAPRSHLTIPRQKTADVVKAAFNYKDKVFKPPQQPEQQSRGSMSPMHGVRIWNSLVSYFMKKSSRKAVNGLSSVRNHTIGPPATEDQENETSPAPYS